MANSYSCLQAETASGQGMASGIRASAGGFRAGRRWLSWALAAALLALAFAFVDLNKVYEAVFALPSSYVIVGIVLCLADRALMALRWFLLIRSLGGRVDFVSVGIASLRSNAISTFVHSIAGDLAKIAYMRRQLDVHSIIIPSLVADRVIGLIVLVPIGICAFVYLSFAEQERLPISGSFPISMLSGAVLLTIIIIALGLKLKGIMGRKAVLRPVLEWISSTASIVQAGSWLWLISLVAVVRQCLGILLVLAYVTYIDGDAEVLELLSIIALQFMIMRLPLAPDGWGVGELTAVGLYGLANVQPEAALVAMLLFHAVYSIACLPGLALILWDRDHLTGSPRPIAAASP